MVIELLLSAQRIEGVLARLDADAGAGLLLRLCLTPCIVASAAALFLLTRPLEPAAARAENGGAGTLSPRAVALTLAILAGLGAATLVLKVTGGPPDLQWTRYPYLDKRWIVLAYWSGVLGVMLLPLLVQAALVRSSRSDERRGSDGERLASTAVTHGARRTRAGIALRAGLSIALRAGLGVALATALFGPPWNTAVGTKTFSSHQQIHWSGLQAIERGHTPYLGAASYNYGPGQQLATYAFMQTGERFDVPGFRASYAFSLWASLAVGYAVLFSLLAFVPALVACLLMLLVSPFLLWKWTSLGVLIGPWGWANPLRMLGPFVLAVSLYALLKERRSERVLVTGAAAVGVLWALCAYFSQENLAAGLVTLGLIVALARATRTIDARSFRRVCLGLAGGFGCACLPVVGFYLSKGALAEFWSNYSLVPARFLRGYANTAFSGPRSEELAAAYFTLPWVVTLTAALALYRVRPLRSAGPLDARRLLILAACSAQLAAFPGAMLRADHWHLAGSLFALPLVVTVALFHLPAVLSGSPVRRWIVRGVVILVVANLFLPTLLDAGARLGGLVRGRASSFSVAAPPRADETDMVARRMGTAWAESDPELATLMRQVRAAAGDRPCCVLIDEPTERIEYAGLVYFIADLNPGPIWLERTDLVADDRMLATFRRHFEEHIERFGALIAFAPDSPESEIFRKAHPGHSLQVLRGRDVEVYVYLRD